MQEVRIDSQCGAAGWPGGLHEGTDMTPVPGKGASGSSGPGGSLQPGYEVFEVSGRHQKVLLPTVCSHTMASGGTERLSACCRSHSTAGVVGALQGCVYDAEVLKLFKFSRSCEISQDRTEESARPVPRGARKQGRIRAQGKQAEDQWAQGLRGHRIGECRASIAPTLEEGRRNGGKRGQGNVRGGRQKGEEKHRRTGRGKEGEERR